jgi:Spy/CpxP family protein refolding chaperone
VKRLVLVLMLSAGAMIAQPQRGFFAWWDSPVARDLNLKEEQNKQIREVVSSYRNKLIDQRSAMEKAEGDLEDIFNDDKIDQRKANDAVDRLANARADMSRTFSQMSLKLRTILTTEQWHELQKRMPRGPGQGMGMGQRPRPGMGGQGAGRDPGRPQMPQPGNGNRGPAPPPPGAPPADRE